MSKNLNNDIKIVADEKTTEKRVRSMVTDTNRVRRSDPGNPDICNVFAFHKVFSPPELCAEIDRECRVAGIGCVDCKKKLAANLNASLAPLRERRAELAKNSDRVWESLRDGARRAGAIADATIAEVRDAIGIVKP